MCVGDNDGRLQVESKEDNLTDGASATGGVVVSATGVAAVLRVEFQTLDLVETAVGAAVTLNCEMTIISCILNSVEFSLS